MAIHSYEGITPTSDSEPGIGATLGTANPHETAPAPPRGGDVGEFDQSQPPAQSPEERLNGLFAALGEVPPSSLQGVGEQAAHGGAAGVAQPTLGPATADGQLATNKPLPEKPLPPLPGPPPGVQADAYGKYMAPSGVASHISIHGSPGFHHEVDQALGKISQSPSGKKLVDDFQRPAQKGNLLTIRETHAARISASAHLNVRQADRYPDLNFAEGNAKATQLAQKRRLGLKGEGSNAEIMWSPDKSLKLNAEGRPTGIVDDKSESHLALAHEMIHARRLVKGTSTAGKGDPYDPSTPAGKEELRAVGIGSKANQKRVSENSIRQELGYPLRTGYKPVQE